MTKGHKNRKGGEGEGGIWEYWTNRVIWYGNLCYCILINYVIMIEAMVYPLNTMMGMQISINAYYCK